MEMTGAEVQTDIRAALKGFNLEIRHEAANPPPVSAIFAVPSHVGVLDPERPLVVGDRGSGKSFWAAALSSREPRLHIARTYGKYKLEQVEAYLGFAGSDVDPSALPFAISKDVLSDLVSREFQPELIWRALLLRAGASMVNANLELPGSWRGLATWCSEDPERFQRALRLVDGEIFNKGRKIVVVFDALDRMADDWVGIRALTRGLLRLAIALRTYKALRLKVFMRVDQASDDELFSFPDASKLRAERVELLWSRTDLYGLLFSRLANESYRGDAFAQLTSEAGFSVSRDEHGVVTLPRPLVEQPECQEDVFMRFAGEYMGVDRRRGRTYSWLHNHLCDARGQAAPRSFLFALVEAAKATSQASERAIDAPGIRSGVQKASETRLDELLEDYRWIRNVLDPLENLPVPSDEKLFVRKWQKAQTVSRIAQDMKRRTFLGPVEFETGGDERSLVQALTRIGVLEVRPDGRINIPDIFRVAARLMRRGGVPVPR
jgi:hypothetical protein